MATFAESSVPVDKARVAPAGFIKAAMIGLQISKVKLSTQHFGD